MMDDGVARKPKPYEDYADVLRQKLDGMPGVSEKVMMGGLCFMLDGNMVAGAHRRGYMFRMGPEREQIGLDIPGAKMMEMGDKGRTMRGFLEAAPETPETSLDVLLGLSLEFVLTLPPK